jgi:hypothetical protein
MFTDLFVDQQCIQLLKRCSDTEFQHLLDAAVMRSTLSCFWGNCLDLFVLGRVQDLQGLPSSDLAYARRLIVALAGPDIPPRVLMERPNTCMSACPLTHPPYHPAPTRLAE